MMEMNLPKDAVMLLSFVNTQLRDQYPSLQEFCAVYDVACGEVEEKLQGIGYRYDRERNQFV